VSDIDNAHEFLEWLDSDAGRELCSTRKGMLLVHEMAIDAALAIKREEAQADEQEPQEA
jgi:hypothetical protein